MGVRYLLFPESPIDDIPHEQLLLESMAKTEAHPAHNTDGHGIFIHPLLSTNITFHSLSSLFVLDRHEINPSTIPGLKPGVCSGLILSGALYPVLKAGVWRRRSINFITDNIKNNIIPVGSLENQLHFSPRTRLLSVRLTGTCPASPALCAGSRGTI